MLCDNIIISDELVIWQGKKFYSKKYDGGLEVRRKRKRIKQKKAYKI